MTSSEGLSNAAADANHCDSVDVKALIRAVSDEASSIQELLFTSIENTKALEKMVEGFVLRDMAEEDALLRIASDVAHAEIEALSNIRYVEFAHNRAQRNSGQQITSPTKVSVPSRSKAHQHFNGIWISSSENEAPDAFFSLRDYGSLVEVLLGWRSFTRSTHLDLDSLLEAITCSVPDITSCVLFVNGAIWTPECSVDSIRFTPQELESIACNGSISVPTEEAHVRWNDTVLKRSLLTKESLRRIESTCSDSGSIGSLLLGDGCDVLAVVNHTRLLRSAVFRGFFFSGNLRALESVGAQVNLLPCVMHSRCHESQEALEGYVIKFFGSLQNSKDCAFSSEKNIAVIVAVQDSSALDPQKSGLEFVLLDVRPLAPTLPFAWHFTWAEICAIGQLKDDGTSSRPFPIFKISRLKLASMEPYDTLSRKFFPSLNAYLLKTPNKPWEDHTKDSLKLVAVAGVVLFGSVLGAALALRRSLLTHY